MSLLSAFNNVIIEFLEDCILVFPEENDFKVYADKLIYEKKFSKLLLKGNVKVRNYFSNEVFIKEASGNELIIFVDKGAFEFNNEEGQRVKTSIRF